MNKTEKIYEIQEYNGLRQIIHLPSGKAISPESICRRLNEAAETQTMVLEIRDTLCEWS